ncbi:MAG: glycosyltransferase family 39 protein [Flavobacteriales bacterium]|nr:glycosyltransferase family 39 protein [Flavobacteriales bacterium]
MDKKWFSSERQKALAFLVFVFWLFLFYQKADVLPKLEHRPTGEHEWAQIDRASMALTYYMDSASFWLPRCHLATNNPEGITAGEFPLIPYTVSKMYSSWGFNELYHRVFVLFLGIVGFVVSFFLALKFIRNPLWAAFVATIWLASPNIIYYSFTFLPDVPALAFLIVSLFFLLHRKAAPRARDLLGFSIFFTLAALIKTSAILPIGAVLFAYIICYGKSIIESRTKALTLVVAATIPIILTALWVLYARNLVGTYRIFIFLLEPLPPTSWADFVSGMTAFSNFLNYYYLDGFRIFLILSTILGLVFVKRSNTFLLLSATFIYLGFFALFLLMFQKSPTHMYYWVPFQIAIFFHLAWLTDLFLTFKIPKWATVAVFALAMVFVNYNAIHVGKNVKIRWKASKEENYRYYDIEPYLESVGVSYTDRVCSYSDHTFNNTLYLMNRKGWTVFVDDPQNVKERALSSCNYAVLNDTSILSDPRFKPYFYNRIGEQNGLTVYRLNAGIE